MTSKLTDREKWLMGQAHYAGGDGKGDRAAPRDACRRQTLPEWLQSRVHAPILPGEVFHGTMEEALLKVADHLFPAHAVGTHPRPAHSRGCYVINAAGIRATGCSQAEARAIAERAAKADGCRTYVIPASDFLSFVEVKPEELQWNGGAE